VRPPISPSKKKSEQETGISGGPGEHSTADRRPYLPIVEYLRQKSPLVPEKTVNEREVTLFSSNVESKNKKLGPRRNRRRGVCRRRASLYEQ